MMPPPDEALRHSPTWAEATGPGQWQPVTLVMALEAVPRRRHPDMLDAHEGALHRFVDLGSEVLDATAWDAPERPLLGLNLLLFAAELASGLGSSLDQAQRRACTETISAATLVAAACLAATTATHQRAAGAQGWNGPE